MLDENAEWWFLGPQDVPCSGRYISRRQIKQFLSSFKDCNVDSIPFKAKNVFLLACIKGGCTCIEIISAD